MPELLVILCHSLCFYGKWPMHRNDLLKACLCPKEKAHNAPSFHMPCTVSSWHKIAGPSNIWEVSTLTPDDLLCGDHWRPRGHWHQGEEHWLSVYSTKYATFTHQVQLKWGLLYKDLDMVQCNNFQQVKTVIAIFLNASEDLRRTTSHETNGQAKLRKRSGIASDFLFIPSHCSVVKIK